MRSLLTCVVVCLLLLFPTFALAQDPELGPKPELKPELKPAPKQEYEPNKILHLMVKCGTMQEVSTTLKQKWGETPMVIGDGVLVFSANNMPVPAKLVLTVNPQTNTFTVNAVLPNMDACILISGGNFTPVKASKNKQKIKLLNNGSGKELLIKYNLAHKPTLALY